MSTNDESVYNIIPLSQMVLRQSVSINVTLTQTFNKSKHKNNASFDKQNTKVLPKVCNSVFSSRMQQALAAIDTIVNSCNTRMPNTLLIWKSYCEHGSYTDMVSEPQYFHCSLGNEQIRGSPLLKTSEPIAYLDPNTRTLHDLFLRGLRLSDGGPCVGWRPEPGSPFQWITYQEVLDRSQRFGSGLLEEGAEANPSQFIGIFSQNRVEWKVVEQACNSFSMVVVPLYDTLGPESIHHILQQCELQYIVVDKNSKAKILLEECKSGTCSLKLLIVMETPNEEVGKLAEETQVKLMRFESVEEEGRSNLKEFVPPKADDLHTICYTSGTTGLPKGVMLTHGNIIADHAGVMGSGEKTFTYMNNRDVYISYLPLAHVFERLMAIAVYYVGGSVGFFQGDVKLLLDDVGTLKPTVFAMVPRLINRIYDKIWAGASQSMIKSFLLRRATNAKMAKLKQGIVTTHTCWDSLVFKKVRASLGGRLRICITGAAPISLEVINFMRCALGVPFSEGYGQTEGTAGICLTIPGDYNSGSVGSPVLSNLVKLIDVPDMNYFARDGKGEVCAKGPSIFTGYYKNDEKTKEALDEDGWLHTGDIGMWLPNGALKIIDRKKHIFKLAQGEYIAPEKIEGVLVQSPALSQVFVYGESLKATLTAIVVPDPDNFKPWCEGKGVKGSYMDLLINDQVNKLVLDDMCAIGRQRGLKSFELPKKIFLAGDLFSIENGMLTPTFKTRRPQVYAYYKDVIVNMYEGLD